MLAVTHVRLERRPPIQLHACQECQFRLLGVGFQPGERAAQVSIDTACSSALVGAHAAAQHLGARGGAALAAGVNLMLAEHTTAATHVAGARCTCTVSVLHAAAV